MDTLETVKNECIAKGCAVAIRNKKRGLCQRHNSLFLATGVMPKADGQCISPDCDRDGPHREMCSKHYQRWTWTDEGRRRIKGRGQGTSVGYDGAHMRARRARGAASEYVCADCENSAVDWSLRHDAKALEIESRGIKGGKLFSPDPYDYEPRCKACHLAYDSKHGLKRRGLPDNYKSTFKPETQEKADLIVELIKAGNTVTETSAIVGLAAGNVSRYFESATGIGIREWKKQNRAGVA